MGRVLLALMPRGNSRAIQKLSLSKELRYEVGTAYVEFWELWKGLIHPWLYGLLGPLAIYLSPPTLSRAFPLFTGKAFLISLVSYLLISGGVTQLHRSQVRKAERRFLKVLEQSSDPSKVLEALCKVDPWRIWFVNVQEKETWKRLVQLTTFAEIPPTAAVSSQRSEMSLAESRGSM